MEFLLKRFHISHCHVQSKCVVRSTKVGYTLLFHSIMCSAIILRLFIWSPHTYIHTYVHKYLVFHITYVVCVNFMRKWRDLQFKVDSRTTDFLRNFLWQFYLRSEFLPEICWEEITEEEILFLFCFDVWPGAWTLAFRLISQHTTY